MSNQEPKTNQQVRKDQPPERTRDGDLPSRFAPTQGEAKSIEVELNHGQKLVLTSNGLTQIKEKADGSVDLAQITFKFEVVAEVRGFKNQDRGLRIEWDDPEGYRHTQMVFREELIADNSEVLKKLASKGFPFVDGTSKVLRTGLQAFLLRAEAPVRARVVDKVGFHGSVFCLPDQSFGPDLNGERVFFLGENEHRYKQRGTLSEWQREIAIHAKGNSRLTFALGLAFAAPLVHKLNASGAGFNLFGPSSTGKTTIAFVAGSVWGGPRYHQTWNTTGNALEASAARHNNTLLILDELNSADPKSIGATAYNLANGSSRARLNSHAEAKEIKDWQLLYLSTSENTLSDLLHKNRETAKAGQEVRLVDFPVCPTRHSPNCRGAFEHSSTFSETYALAKHLDISSKCQYGTAIGPFLDRFVRLSDEEVGLLRDWRASWVQHHTPKGADPQVQRVVELFGLVALGGQLASQWGIIPVTEEENEWAINECLKSWLVHRGHTHSGESDKAVHYLLEFISTYGSSRFERLDDFGLTEQRPIQRRAGWMEVVKKHNGDEYVTEDIVYYFTTQGFKEACNDLNPKETAKLLHEMGVNAHPCATTKRISSRQGSHRVHEVSFRELSGGPIPIDWSGVEDAE